MLAQRYIYNSGFCCKWTNDCRDVIVL